MRGTTQEYAASANANTLVCLMLEEVEAIENIDEIVDAVLVHVDGLHTNISRTALAGVSRVPLRMVQVRNSG